MEPDIVVIQFKATLVRPIYHVERINFILTPNCRGVRSEPKCTAEDRSRAEQGEGAEAPTFEEAVRRPPPSTIVPPRASARTGARATGDHLQHQMNLLGVECGSCFPLLLPLQLCTITFLAVFLELAAHEFELPLTNENFLLSHVHSNNFLFPLILRALSVITSVLFHVHHVFTCTCPRTCSNDAAKVLLLFFYLDLYIAL